MEDRPWSDSPKGIKRCLTYCRFWLGWNVPSATKIRRINWEVQTLERSAEKWNHFETVNRSTNQTIRAKCDDRKSEQNALPGEFRMTSARVKHTFTHFHLHLSVAVAKTKEPAPVGCRFVAIEDFGTLALPTVMKKVIDQRLQLLDP